MNGSISSAALLGIKKICLDIDRLILKAKNVDELLAELEMLGNTVRRGKYISVKAPNQQRAVRLKTLGEDYTKVRDSALFYNIVLKNQSVGKP